MSASAARGRRSRGARRACQSMIHAELGWVRGYPLGLADGGVVPWAVASPVGRAPAAPIGVDRSRLRAARHALVTLGRRLPRARGPAVGDARAWRRGVELRLDLLEAPVHLGAHLPDLPAIAARAASRRNAARLLAAAADPASAHLAYALAWVHAGDDARLTAATEALERHGEALARLVGSSLEPARVALGVRLLQLAGEDDAALATLLSLTALADAPAPQPAYALRLAKALRKRAKHSRRGRPPRPAPETPAPLRVGHAVRELVEGLLAAPAHRRAERVALTEAVLPRPAVAAWSERAARLRREVATGEHLLTLRPVSRAAAGSQVAASQRLVALADRWPSGTDPDEAARRLSALFAAAPGAGAVGCLEAIVRRSPSRLAARLGALAAWREAAAARPPWRRRRHAQLAGAAALVALPFPEGGTPSPGDRRRWVACGLPRRLAGVAGGRAWLARLFAVLADLLLDPPAWDDDRWGPAGSYGGWELVREVVSTDCSAREAVALIRAGLADEDVLVHDEQQAVVKAAVALAARTDRARAPRLLRVLAQLEWSERRFEALGAFTRPDLVDLALAALDAGEVDLLAPLVGACGLLRAIDRAAAAGLEPTAAHGEELDVERYPAPLRARLARLAAVDPRARTAAQRILGKDLPDPHRVARELEALTREAGRQAGARGGAIRARIATIGCRRVAAPSPARLGTLQAKLDRRIRLAELRRWQGAAEAALAAALSRRVGRPVPAAWARPPLSDTLAEALSLEGPYRSLARRLLRARLGPAPWDLRDDPRNAAFLARLAGLGIDLGPWLDGAPPREVEAADGSRLTLALEADPLEVLRMGTPFATCLSPGRENYYSAVVNAADVNKRVLYARLARGKVVGRCLLALTDAGELLTYHPYAVSEALGFTDLAAAFVRRLASAMGTVAVRSGAPSALLAPDWYDDGTTNLARGLAFLDADSPLRASLPTLDPRLLPAALAAAARRLSPAVIDAALALAEVKARPELALALLPCALERAAHLRPATALWAAERAREAGREDAARRLAQVLEAKRGGLGDACAGRLATLLVELGEPSRALRYLRATRGRGVRSVADERGARRQAASGALAALHRRREAAALLAAGA